MTTTMRQKYIARHNNLTYKIIEDNPDGGFYVFAYDANGNDTHDYLQDNLDMAKKCALDEFDVPLDAWTEVAEVMCCFCGDGLYFDEAFQLAISPTVDTGEVQAVYAHKKCLDKVLHKDIVRHPDI